MSAEENKKKYRQAQKADQLDRLRKVALPDLLLLKSPENLFVMIP